MLNKLTEIMSVITPMPNKRLVYQAITSAALSRHPVVCT